MVVSAVDWSIALFAFTVAPKRYRDHVGVTLICKYPSQLFCGHDYSGGARPNTFEMGLA